MFSIYSSASSLFLIAVLFLITVFFADTDVLIPDHISEDKALVSSNFIVEAVVGEPVRIYYDNLFYVKESKAYQKLAQCTCSFGQYNPAHWIGTPQEDDIGIHTLSVQYKSLKDDKLLAATLTIRVSAKANTKMATEIPLTLFFLGDSITRQQYYPNQVLSYFIDSVNERTNTIGKVSIKFELEGYAQSINNGLRTESYNGWPTYFFLEEDFQFWPEGNPESDVTKSPFWFPEQDGEGELSFIRYLDEIHEGNSPDLVFIMLGTNDIAGKAGDVGILNTSVTRALNSIDALINLIKTANPSVKIFVLNPPPPSSSSVAFVYQYGSKTGITTPSSMRYGHLYYSSKLADHFSWRGEENVYYIPLHLNFNNHEGYHAEQVVHPSAFGHHQIAQSIISYMNYFFQNAGSTLITSASGSNPDADIHSKIVDEVTKGNENLNN